MWASFGIRPIADMGRIRPSDHRHRWTRDENKLLLLCYYSARPDERGYRARLHQLWKTRHGDNGYTEQKLSGQVASILRRGVFTDLELMSLKTAAADGSESLAEQIVNTRDQDQSPLRNIVMDDSPCDPENIVKEELPCEPETAESMNGQLVLSDPVMEVPLLSADNPGHLTSFPPALVPLRDRVLSVSNDLLGATK